MLPTPTISGKECEELWWGDLLTNTYFYGHTIKFVSNFHGVELQGFVNIRKHGYVYLCSNIAVTNYVFNLQNSH
jgi:hypothetical protein